MRSAHMKVDNLKSTIEKTMGGTQSLTPLQMTTHNNFLRSK